MKLFFACLVFTSSLSAFADSSPTIRLNDEQFREAIELGLEQSSMLQTLSAQSVIDANVVFANRTCQIRMSIEDPGYHFKGSFTRNARNIEKCQQILTKFVAHGGLPF